MSRTGSAHSCSDSSVAGVTVVAPLFPLQAPQNMKVRESEALGETLTPVRDLAHRNPLPQNLQF